MRSCCCSLTLPLLLLLLLSCSFSGHCANCLLNKSLAQVLPVLSPLRRRRLPTLVESSKCFSSIFFYGFWLRGQFKEA